MADTDGMQLVFRVGGGGFVLPVRDLVEVAEILPEQVEPVVDSGRVSMDGWIACRGTRVPLFSLARRLLLPELSFDEPFAAVVMTGADGLWAIRADHVTGIFPAAEFTRIAAPPWMFAAGRWPFAYLALWRGQPLVQCEALDLEARWETA